MSDEGPPAESKAGGEDVWQSRGRAFQPRGGYQAPPSIQPYKIFLGRMIAPNPVRESPPRIGNDFFSSSNDTMVPSNVGQSRALRGRPRPRIPILSWNQQYLRKFLTIRSVLILKQCTGRLGQGEGRNGDPWENQRTTGTFLVIEPRYVGPTVGPGAGVFLLSSGSGPRRDPLVYRMARITNRRV